jgi:hypothetical protein
MKYGNLLDYLNEKSSQIADNFGKVNESEYRDALRVLEEDNFINMFGHGRAPTIRF